MATETVTLTETVTTGGWYPTTDGRWAEVRWVDGQPVTVRVAAAAHAAKTDAEVAAEFAEADAAR